MSNKTLFLNDKLYQYLCNHSLVESAALQQLRITTAQFDSAVMQICPEQGQFMTLILRLMQAKRAIELGTYTGYSALCIANGLTEDGQLIACDIDHRWIEMARRHWQMAGVDHKIEFRLGQALESLDNLIQTGQSGCFDFVFIDADKARYDQYYERALTLVRKGGLIAIDNVLWEGAVIDPNDHEATTQAIRKLNAKLKDDPRVLISLLPIGDGLTLALKK